MITLKDAEGVLSAAMKKARSMKLNDCIAVVDVHGNLVAFSRMENAWVPAINLSINKAYTAGTTGFPTGELGKIAQPGQVAYGIANSDQGRMVIFAGGLPLFKDGQLVGGIGISGGLADQDETVAKAGVESFS